MSFNRNTSYDNISATVHNLSVVNKEFASQINKFFKSANTEERKKHIDDVIKAQNNLVNAVNKQFDDLAGDFYSGKINLVKYREGLSPLKIFLNKQDKTFQPKTLQVPRMLKEILRFC